MQWSHSLRSLSLARGTARSLGLIPLALCFALALPTAASAQKSPAPVAATPASAGSITGKVSEKHGGPMAGARVSVTNTQTAASTSVATDVNGQFTVENLPAGAYKVSISAEDCVAQEEKVTVKPGHKSKLSVTLKPEVVATPAPH